MPVMLSHTHIGIFPQDHHSIIFSPYLGLGSFFCPVSHSLRHSFACLIRFPAVSSALASFADLLQLRRDGWKWPTWVFFRNLAEHSREELCIAHRNHCSILMIPGSSRFCHIEVRKYALMTSQHCQPTKEIQCFGKKNHAHVIQPLIVFFNVDFVIHQSGKWKEFFYCIDPKA